ncbi:rust resistance kinase Lr10-like isoform X2 [Coffea eugenioides]|uniref:rust resistance kinase Lr10-like isoform X2 n=1 Tax=Coffea eugenioides TaxID=49369 RepID=UPI000F606050|nr:rust resistance kinase Lr10-like isoform X2 [Coffea eugenioides]
MEIWRLVIVAISFSSLLSPAIFADNVSIAPAAAPPDDVCAEKRCSPDGPAVRFPFLLRGKQPEECGYNNPGYNLYCDNGNHTLLEVPPSSMKFVVKNIDYKTQMIQVQFAEGCQLKYLRNLDLSSTPFQFSAPDYIDRYLFTIDRYTLFNCSLANDDGWSSDDEYDFSCLDTPGYKVRATRSDTEIRFLSVELCTKMYDTNLVSGELFGMRDLLNLAWSLPECKKCEVHEGGICRWKNGTNNKFDCFGGKPDSGVSKKLLISGPIVGCFFLILATSALHNVYKTKKIDRENQKRIRTFLEDYAAMKPTRYSYADIKRITNDFKDKLGEGGYGNVFKGKISNEIFVAVKLLHNSTGNGEEFINEVGTMGTIHHVNVVRLVGFCADGFKRALVYEFLPNGSLDKFIFPEGQEHHNLGMEKLQNIAFGIARGIEYLHQGCEQRILHFDIKPHNILLDNSFNPKISDFGLAKLCEKGRSAVSMTAARGTMGYIAPEVFSRHFGNVSYKSDIYSFGMLLLEMVGRRKNIDANVQNVSQVYYPEWVYGRLVQGEDLRIQVEEDGEEIIAKKLAIVGLWCIQWNPVDRPSITFVLQMLEGNGESPSLPPSPFTSTDPMNPSNPSLHGRHLASGLAVISELE